MKKRLMSLILVLAMLLPMIPVQGAAAGAGRGFRDVKEDDWFYEAVEYVRVNGIFTGTSSTTFSPNNTMTRGMFVTVLGRMAGVDSSRYAGKSSFRDVPVGAWYTPYVAWAKKYGIAAGTGNGKFSPNAPVDRQQMAVFFVRYFEAFKVDYNPNNDRTSVPADIDSAAPWAREPIIKLWRTGLVNGKGGANFYPKDTALRAEAAQICYRADRVVDIWYKEPGGPSGRIKIDPATGKPYPDKEEKPEPTAYYEVQFAMGSGQAVIELPAAKTYASGTRIDALPTPVQQEMLFLGWYYDPELTQPAEASDTLSRNMTLYAKTGNLDGISVNEAINYITAADVDSGFPLKLKLGDGFDPNDLTITQVSANNAEVDFTVDSDGVVHINPVTDPEGNVIYGSWEPGHTYSAVLKDGSPAVFDYNGEQPASVRTFNIIVKKEEVQSLAVDDADGKIKYIPKSQANGVEDFEGLFTASLETGADGELKIESVKETGSFTYTGNEKLVKGDILAIYEGKHPKQRNTSGDTPEDNEAAIAYVEITGVNGRTFDYKTAEVEDILFTPDVLPVSNAADQISGDGNVLTAGASVFDYSDSEFNAAGLDSTTTVDVGDFIAFYSGELEDAESLSYGKITEVEKDGDTYTVKYETVSESDVYASMDVYTEENKEIELTEEEIEDIEQKIETQAEESGFVEEAAEYLAALALETDGFQELAEDFDIQEYTSGFSNSYFAAKAGMARASRLTTDVKNEVEADVHFGKLDHFDDSYGARVALTVSLEFEVVGKKGQKVVVSLQAVFEQEVMLSVNASGGAIWKWCGIIPYIDDYRLNANLDMGAYTGVGITATAKTEGAEDEKFDWDTDAGSPAGNRIIDIGQQLKNLIEKKHKFLNYNLVDETKSFDDDDDGGIPIAGGLEEKYAAMIEDADDSWIDLFRQEIFSVEGSVDPLHILCYGVNADFVVGANLYATMGMTFDYGAAKRYNFSILLFRREVTNRAIDLETPHYEFTFYVMGTVGIRAGVEFELGVGLVSLKLDSVGITAEAGVYLQMWGYFFYDLKGEYNENTGKFDMTNKYSGAMLIEVGAYLNVSFKAQLFGSKKLTYQPTLYENRWPFYSVGDHNNVLDFAEKDDNGNDIETEYDLAVVRTLTLPSPLFSMRYMDMTSGEIGGDEDDDGEMTPGLNCDDSTESRFTIEMSDPHYTYKPANNTVTVNPGNFSVLPDCEMTIRWKNGCLAFSSQPIERTVVIRWSDPENAAYIAFDSKGGSPVKQILGDPGMAITAPNPPAKKGYDFGGWYSDSACTAAYPIPAKMPETFSGGGKGMTVYAKWIPRDDTPYTVQHYRQELDGTYTLADTENLEGTTDSPVTVTTKSGGAYTGFKPASVTNYRIAGNGTTVVRQYYTREVYKVEFTYGSLSGTPRVYNAKYGATIYAPMLAVKGYICDGFAGFTQDDENGGMTVTGNASFAAAWSPGEAGYRVEHYTPRSSGDGYILSGENAVETKTGTTGTVISPEALKRQITGYTYASYKALVDGSEVPEGGNVTVSGDGSTVVKLYYGRSLHSVTMDPNGGYLNGTTAPRDFQVYYGARPSAVTPVRTGYSFAGWYTDAACSDGKFFSTDAAPVITGDIALYAKWTPRDNTAYKVEHYQQDITGSGYTLYATEALTGTTGAAVTANEKAYAHFTCNPSADGTVASGDIAADGSLVLRLYYDREILTVTYDPDGGTLTGEPTQTFRYGAAFTAPGAARTGYGLDGWYAGGVKYDSSKTVTADMTVTAKWAAGTVNYTVEHYQQDLQGKYPEDPVYTDTRSGKADAAVYLSGLKRSDTGFTFDHAGKEAYTIAPDGSTVVKLYYTRNKHTVTWNLNGGTAPGGYTTGRVYYGAPITAPVPVRTGYTLSWSSTPAVIMPDYNVTYYASWTPISYTVKFDLNGGSSSKTFEDVTYKYYNGPTLPKVTEIRRDYYTLTGWSDGQNMYEPEQWVSGLATEDGAVVTLTAVWTPIKYRFRFYLDGGTLEGYGPSGSSDSITIEYTIEDVGEDGLVPPVPTKTGYTFLGWHTSWYTKEPIEKITSSDLIYNMLVDFYAKWELTKVEINYRLLPEYNNDEVTDVQDLLLSGWTIPDKLAAGDDLPTRQRMNSALGAWREQYFLYWVDENGNEITKVPENIEGSYTVYMMFVPAKIKTAKDLDALRLACKDDRFEYMKDCSFRLADNIYLDDNWEPIEEFSGYLSGHDTKKTDEGYDVVIGTYHIIWTQTKIKPLFNKISNRASVDSLEVIMGQDGDMDLTADGFLETEDGPAFGCIACVAEGSWITSSGVGRGTIRFNPDVQSGETINFGTLAGIWIQSDVDSFSGHHIGDRDGSNKVDPVHIITNTTNPVNLGGYIGLIKSSAEERHKNFICTFQPHSRTIFALTIQAPNAAPGSAIGAFVGDAGNRPGTIMFMNYSGTANEDYGFNYRIDCPPNCYAGLVGRDNVEDGSLVVFEPGKEDYITLTINSNIDKIVGNRENSYFDFVRDNKYTHIFNESAGDDQLPAFP